MESNQNNGTLANLEVETCFRCRILFLVAMNLFQTQDESWPYTITTQTNLTSSICLLVATNILCICNVFAMQNSLFNYVWTWTLIWSTPHCSQVILHICKACLTRSNAKNIFSNSLKISEPYAENMNLYFIYC